MRKIRERELMEPGKLYTMPEPKVKTFAANRTEDKMSNANVNSKGKIISSGAAPKSTSLGADLSGDATNCIKGTKVTSKPLSPSANAASQAKGK